MLNKELQELLESMEEGQETEEMDLSSDVVSVTKFELCEEKSERKGVLCTLVGVGMGPFSEENNNERDYSADVAEIGILQSPYVKNMMRCKTLLGEPHHPKGRNEIWTNHTSHCITDMWLDKDRKNLYIKLDVLDTPNGRIIKTLVDYGCILGVSARASGKTRKVKGRLVVIPEFYKFRTFDIVTNPGFHNARVSEDGNVNEETEELFTKLENLTESFDEETLKSVKSVIEYCDDEKLKGLLPLVEEKLNKTDNSEEENEDDLLEELNEALDESRRINIDLKRENNSLKEQVMFLRTSKKESVSDPQVEMLRESVVTLKRSLALRSENLSEVHSDVEELRNLLNEALEENENLKSELKEVDEKRKMAADTIRSYRELNKALNEEIKSKEKELVDLLEEGEEPVSPKARKKVGIGNIVTTSTESLNEEVVDREGNKNRVNLIRRIGGN